MEQQLEPVRPGEIASSEEPRGAIGIALIIWLFGGGLGLAILVFILLKAC